LRLLCFTETANLLGSPTQSTLGQNNAMHTTHTHAHAYTRTHSHAHTHRFINAKSTLKASADQALLTHHWRAKKQIDGILERPPGAWYEVGGGWLLEFGWAWGCRGGVKWGCRGGVGWGGVGVIHV